jgi:hypothetical protein
MQHRFTRHQAISRRVQTASENNAPLSNCRGRTIDEAHDPRNSPEFALRRAHVADLSDELTSYLGSGALTALLRTRSTTTKTPF